MSKAPVKNRLIIEAMGMAAAASPFITTQSSSRNEMVSSHLSQAIVPLVSDVPYIMTGFERQLASHVFNIRMPVDGTVVAIFQKHLTGIGQDAISSSPSTTMIYQNADTGEYSYLNIDKHMMNHNTFGYPLVMNNMVRSLRPGTPIAKDTILAQSPNVHAGDVYSTSLNTNVIFLSDPGVEQDGYVVSDRFCQKAAPLEMDDITIECGRNWYPLNLYGTDTVYKPFPDIGDIIRPDGLVAVLRAYDDNTDALNMSPAALRQIDFIHDKRFYVTGEMDAEVYDVIVNTGINDVTKMTVPKGMETQMLKYLRSLDNYYENVITAWRNIVKECRGYEPKISPALQALITRAMAQKPQEYRSKRYSGLVSRAYKGTKLDEFRIQIFFHARKPLTYGSKLSDDSGTKGVICGIRPWQQMPYDKHGNYVDVIVYNKAPIARLTSGALYTQYINAASRDLAKWIRDNRNNVDASVINQRLLRYYEITSPRIARVASTWDPGRWNRHIDSVCEDGIYLYMVGCDEHIGVDIIRNIIKEGYKPLYETIYVTSLTGKTVETVCPMLIGSRKTIVLEKTDHRPMATSTCVLQHHGLPAGSSREMRNAHPGKRHAPRVNGESEVRLKSATIGGDVMAEILEWTNDPDKTRIAVNTILDADVPSRIPRLVDPTLSPAGRSRALLFIKMLSRLIGIKFIDVEQSR